jgi:hypothetical protein
VESAAHVSHASSERYNVGVSQRRNSHSQTAPRRGVQTTAPLPQRSCAVAGGEARVKAAAGGPFSFECARSTSRGLRRRCAMPPCAPMSGEKVRDKTHMHFCFACAQGPSVSRVVGCRETRPWRSLRHHAQQPTMWEVTQRCHCPTLLCAPSKCTSDRAFRDTTQFALSLALHPPNLPPDPRLWYRARLPRRARQNALEL